MISRSSLTEAEVERVLELIWDLRRRGFIPASELSWRIDAGAFLNAGCDVLHVTRLVDRDLRALGFYAPPSVGRIEVAPFSQGRPLRVELRYEEDDSLGFSKQGLSREALDLLPSADEPWFPAWVATVARSVQAFRQQAEVIALLVISAELRDAADSAFRLGGQGAVTELLRAALSDPTPR